MVSVTLFTPDSFNLPVHGFKTTVSHALHMQMWSRWKGGQCVGSVVGRASAGSDEGNWECGGGSWDFRVSLDKTGVVRLG